MFKKEKIKEQTTQDPSQEIADAIGVEKGDSVPSEEQKDPREEELIAIFTALSDEEKISLFVEKAKAAEDMLALAQRTQADMINYRLRKEKEVEENKTFATASFIEKIIPLIENFELALKSSSVAECSDESAIVKKYDDTIKGMDLIYAQFITLLEDSKVEIINPANHEKFDPHKHEALLAVKDESKDDGQIIEVMQKGYELNGRLLRSAKVKVVRN